MSNKPLRDLRKEICTHFDLDELKILTYDLSIDWDELVGSRKSAKVQDLIVYLGKRNKLQALFELLREERPNVLWEFNPSEINSCISDLTIREAKDSDNIQLKTILEKLNKLHEDISTLPLEILESINKSEPELKSEKYSGKVIEKPNEMVDQEVMTDELVIVIYCLHQLTQATVSYNIKLDSFNNTLDELLSHNTKGKRLGKKEITQLVGNLTNAMSIYSSSLDRNLPKYANAHSHLIDIYVEDIGANLKAPTLESFIEISSIQKESYFYLEKVRNKVNTGKYFLQVSDISFDPFRSLITKRVRRTFEETKLKFLNSLRLDIETFEFSEQHMLKAIRIFDAASEYIQFTVQS